MSNSIRVYSREKRLNNRANSAGPSPGPVSLTLTNSHTGVSSGTGSVSGIPSELGSAHVSSAGGTNETSKAVVIFRTLLDAVNRMALEMRLVMTWPSRTGSVLMAPILQASIDLPNSSASSIFFIFASDAKTDNVFLASFLKSVSTSGKLSISSWMRARDNTSPAIRSCTRPH